MCRGGLSTCTSAAQLRENLSHKYADALEGRAERLGGGGKRIPMFLNGAF